jgi:hypothetical protein
MGMLDEAEWRAVGDIEDLAGLAQSTSIFLSLNIRSLTGKLGVLRGLVKEVPLKMILLQEVWRTPVGADLSLPNFGLPRMAQRKTGKGGGVGCYFHSCLSVTEVPNLNFFKEGVYESQVFSISEGLAKPIIMVNVYRPPAGNIVEALEFIEQQLGWANQ